MIFRLLYSYCHQHAMSLGEEAADRSMNRPGKPRNRATQNAHLTVHREQKQLSGGGTDGVFNRQSQNNWTATEKRTESQNSISASTLYKN